jgi:hypothetical protein
MAEMILVSTGAIAFFAVCQGLMTGGTEVLLIFQGVLNADKIAIFI